MTTHPPRIGNGLWFLVGGGVSFLLGGFLLLAADSDIDRGPFLAGWLLVLLAAVLLVVGFWTRLAHLIERRLAEIQQRLPPPT